MRLLERHPAFLAYILSGLVFTALMYLLLFNVHSQALENCELRNAQVVEMNNRATEVNDIAETLSDYMTARLSGDRSKIAEGVPQVKRTRRTLDMVRAEQVIPNNCSEIFRNPWPFN